MVKKSKKLIVLLLVLIVYMLVWGYMGLIGLLDNGKDGVVAGDNSLGAGDWIYLDISSATNWADGGAKTNFYYSSTSGWQVVEMDKYSSTLYRTRIPDNMSSSGEFKFFRAEGNDPNKIWNWLPGGNANLTLSGATSNTLCVTNSGFTSYNWKSTWTIVNNAGELLYFMNMGSTSISSVKAVFYVEDTPATITEVAMTEVSGVTGLYQVKIPDGADYDMIRFVDSESNVLATERVMGGSYEPNGNNTYYYNRTELDEGNICVWDVYPEEAASITGKKLYLDMWNFSVDDGKTITIQIGDGEAVILKPDSDDETIYSYTIPSNSGATQRTILTINMDGKYYHFLWSDISKDTITYIATDILAVADSYSSSTSGTRKIYFDATLSKLSYVGDAGDIGIPLAGSEAIYYHAWSSTGAVSSADGTMTKLTNRTIGQNTWKDVYVVELHSDYDRILFYSNTTEYNAGTANCTKTKNLEIPGDLKNPCFYADSSDVIAYATGENRLRDGYWGEVYKIRNAEEGKVNSDIVYVQTTPFDRDSKVLYVNTTLYDYYSDYELNGLNRDTYDVKTSVNSHRIYQQFRQFNQALSAYYEKNQASSPLYWGNAQNYSGNDSNHYNEIADSLGLYGFTKDSNSDLYKKFFYENNSMWGRDGKVLANGNNATIGLTLDKLSNGNLMLSTNNGTSVVAPFFDESFITGNNSKNTVLGEVYHSVSFPFVKMPIKVTDDGQTVEYWYYNSADQSVANKNLQLREASNGKYYLASTDNVVNGASAEGNPTSSSNYFPFNTSGQSGNAPTLNYGFGQKIEFTFRLTSDGTVVASKGDQVPIQFVFEGDDDVWVYIDGELVLDIGGGHGAVKGTIDFQHKNSTVNSVKSTESGIKGELKTNFPSTLFNDTEFYNKEHTLTMYYMERGLWESNMSIIFNFPDENKLSVEKEVDTTKVNDLFKDLFDNKSVFSFNIRNQATHYGSQPVTLGDEAKPKIFNADFIDGTVAPSNPYNEFKYVGEYVGQSHVAQWYAGLTDAGGVYKDERWGIIYPSTGAGKSLDVSNQNVYLQFKVYYAYQDTPQLMYMRIELEDKKGNKIGGALNGKTYGNSSISPRTWTTLQIDLREFSGYESFNFAEVAKIKFDYDYPRYFCIDDVIFKPAVNATTLVGFIMQQDQIPDYGSATSGKLENAVNALYSTTDENGNIGYGRVDEAGYFALEDGQRITFSNQFRRGSYIYLEENINANVFDVTWKIYDDDDEVIASRPSESSVVIGGGDLTDNVTTGTVISDMRQEVYKTGTDSSGKTIENKVYTATGPAKIGDGTDETTTTTTNTIVFRSYSFPESEAVGIDLLIKMINTVRTGALTIEKKQAADSQELTGEYTIRIEFSNVAGMGLESEETIVHEVVLKAGEKKTITGIPAGTIYTITEVLGDGDLKLESIEKIKDTNGNVIGNDDMYVLVDGVTKVQGVIQADDVENETTATGFVFVNSLTPTINLNLKKLWKAADGETDVSEGLPESIWVQIQRKAAGENIFTAVDIPGATDGCIEILPGYDGWTQQILGLDKYKDNKKAEPYTYRVVEMQKQEGGSLAEASGTFWYSGLEFEVIYDNDINLTEEDATKEYSYIITNKSVDTFNLSITKVQGAGDSIAKLSGAEFVLYEYKDAVELETYSDVMEAIQKISEDSTMWEEHQLTENNSVYLKTGLSKNSVFYLVETKVPTGMQSPNGCWKIKYVTDESSDANVHEHIKITPMPKITNGNMPAIGYYETATSNGIEGWFITNLEQWDIPETGGIGLTYPYMAGICLMLLAVVWGGTLYYRDRRRQKT